MNTYFKLSGKDPVFNALFTHTVTVQNKITFKKKKKVGISLEEGFLMPRSFMTLFMVSVDTWLN